jgi:hypothetical protein
VYTPAAVRDHRNHGRIHGVTKRTVFGIAAVSLGAAAISCAGAVWLTNDLRAFGLGLIPAGVLAAALIWHFERTQA